MTSPTDSNARGASKSVRIAGRSASGAGTRKARLRRAVLESLEDRTLLALLPPPSVTGRVDVSNSNGNESAPSIAVDPTNAQHVVSVWQRVDASLGLTPVIAEAAYSLDGGKSWAKFDLPAPLPDPALGPPTPGTPFAWTTDAGVAFDRSGDFYIVESQHDKLYAEGAIVLHKFSLTDTGPQQVFTNRVVYQWMGDTPDMAFTPTIAVDSGVGNQAVDMPVGSPADVLFAPNGSLYVSVENLNQVQKFNGTDGTFQNVFASGLGVFRPNDLTVSPVDGDLYISNRQDGNVLRVDGATGATKGVFTSPLKRFQAPGDAVIGLDGNLYVTSRDTDAVLRFNAQTGAFLGTFVPSRTGGLKAPEGLAFGVDGKLYVTSGGTNEVKRYDGLTGAFIDTFVPDTAGLDDPRGLAFGPDGNLYVSSFNTDAVLKFDRITGGSLGAFAAGATLDGPTSIAFGPDDGNLYVDSTNSDEVLRFSGLNGAFLSTFIPAGTGGLKAPEGLVFRPNGLYVGSGGTDAVLRFNPRTGALVGTFIKPGDGGLDGPSGIAFATGGDAFVASRNSNQVYRYGAASGTFKNTITPEPLKTPRYSTVGPDGNVYVTSRDTDSVVRYDGLTGQFLGTFVASGSGGLDQPSGLTFGLDGNLYVADGFNNRILKFNGFTGQFLGVFVTTAGNGGLEGVQAIAYGGDGNLYAASNATDSVLKYNGVDGTFLGIFTPAPLRTPEDAVIGPDGKLYVSSRNLNEVLRYDGTTGDFLDVFVQPKAGGLTTARGLAFAANGDLLVSSFDTNQVLRYKASDGSFVGDFIPVPLKAPEGAVLGPDGDLYVAASDSDRILRYNGTTGAFDRIFASSADSPLTKPIGLAFHNGDLFVASRDSGQILRYNGTTGAYLGPFVDAGGSLNIPSEIVFGPDGNLYVSDLGTDEVHRYNGTTGADMGVFVAAGAGGLNGPRGLAFDGAGRLYVASSNTDQVLRYLGTSGAFDSVFVGGTLTAPVPVGLAFRAGNLYVSSATTNRIYRYDATGTFIDIFVPAGQGGLVAPSGLAFTAGGDLLVAGKGTDRVLLFKGTNGSWVKDFTPTPLTHPTGITRGPDGNVYVSSRDGNFVAKYDGNGAYLGQFTPEPLVQPEGAVLSKDGLSLFVAHSASNEILRYDAATGAFLGIFVTKGSGGLSKPTDLTIDATGDLYVISSGTDEVLRYDAATGAFKSTFVSAGKGGLAGAAGLKFDVAGNLFVSSSGTNQVMRYDNTGASSPSAGNTGAIFVIAGAGGLGFPAGLDILGTRLYVASRGTNQILSYDLTSGAGATTFVGTGNGLSQPREIVWGADGKLYVESFGSNSVLRYDGTGKFIDTFVTTGSGGLNSPSGMLFLGGNLLLSSTGTDAVLKYAGADGKFQGAFTAEALRAPEDVQFLPDGSLLVASNGGNSVLRFNGATGASLGAFIPAGSGGLAAPQSIAVDIAGNVYVTSETGHAVLRYDGTTGAFANVFVPAGAGGLKTPQGLVFAADGSLLVASFGSDEILRYAAGTGAVLGPFTPAALQKPSGILFGPDGKLYVSSETRDYVVRYDGISGKFDRIFTSASLKAPRDAVLGPDGKLYVASQDTNEILRYDGATGAFIDVFVSKGSGGLSQPHGLAFGKDGNLYVSSFATNQILRYRGTTGAFMNVFASAAINQPEGLTFGPDNNLYVASSGNNQVLRYRAASGAFLGAFATAGLSSPRGVTFGADGNLYVASFGTNQVLSYKGGTGALIGAFVAAGSGGLIGPGNIAFGPDGSLYVNSIGNNEVIRYSGATGAFLDVVVPTSRGGLNGATGLTFTADGGGLLVGSLNTDQILQYDINNGAFLGPFTPGALRDPTGLAFDAAGNLYVSSFTTDTVLKYAAGTGRLLSNFVPAGSGALDGPVGLTFLNGRLFVAGSLGDNVIRYGASDGTFLDALNPTRPNAPADSVIGPDGLLYVSSRDSDSVLRYDPATGRLLGTFVTPKAGGLKQPQGLAFGADGNLYVASTGTNAVLRFNGRTGVFLDTFVAAGTGGLARPQGLVFGPDGNLYVASFDQDAVLRFRGSTGAFLSTFVPSGNGKLDGPTSLAFLPNGDLLVASYNNDSILRYKVGTAQFLGAFVPQGSNGLDGPVSIIIGPDKNLYVASDAASPAFIIPDLAADTNRDNRVLRFDGITGAFLGAFVARGDGGMQGPAGLSFGPDGSLYVSDRGNNRILRFNGITGAFDKALDIINDPYGIVFGPDVNGDGRPELYAASINTDSIVRYDGVTGEYLDTLVTPRSGGLRAPKDLRFGPDGNLYVSSSGNNQVLKYNSMTGAFLGVAASGGGLANPEGLAFDSLGRLYVASRTTSSVLRYNPTTGAFIDAFVAPGAGGLVEPRGLNFAADGSLEIASYGTNKVLRYDSSGAYVGVFTHAAAQAFTDPDSKLTQNNKWTGNVYISWATNLIGGPVNGVANPNPSAILLVASSDGGNSFSPPTVVNDSKFTSPIELDAQPKLAVSQGTIDGKIAPGQVSVIWDDFGSGNLLNPLNPPRDFIRADRVMPGSTGAATMAFAKDDIKSFIASTSKEIATTTRFALPVAVTDPRFTTLSHLDVRLSLVHPDLSQLEIDIIAPNGTRVPLVRNPNLHPGAVGITGDRLGGPDDYIIDTIFDQSAPRSIADPTFASPYIGRFVPDTDPGDSKNKIPPGLTLDAFNGMTRDQIGGFWTLEITDFSGADAVFPDQRLVDWGIDFTSNMKGSTDSLVGTTFVTGRLTGATVDSVATTGPYDRSPAAPLPLFTATTPIGIGPGATIAADNTLGSFSARQGRIYAAYTQYDPFRAFFSDDTDIVLVSSDNGGITWSPEKIVNDDNGQTDGFSESLNDPNFTKIGRPQYEPSIAVDPTTGFVALSFYDARNDASRARVATYVAVSGDGGDTFAPKVFANTPNTALDAISRKTVVLGPIPDNQSPRSIDPFKGNSLTDDKFFSYGDHQALAFYAGRLYPAWSGNENGGIDGAARLDIRVASVLTTAGPRVLSSTMGPVRQETVHDLGGAPIDFNNLFDATGAPIADGFVVEFDRPIDANSFDKSDVKISYRNVATSGFAAGVDVPPLSVLPLLEGNTPQGPTKFLVRFTPSSATGTYSYSVGPFVTDRIRSVVGTTVIAGNAMDQNANGSAGEDPAAGPIIGTAPGDVYAAPTPAPKSSTTFFGAEFTPPYDRTTQPLIVPGPHVVRTFVPGSTPTVDNLVLDGTVSQLAVVFDRDMKTSLPATSVVRIVGPAGEITGPFSIVHDPADSTVHPRVFLVNFPSQQLSGTYTVVLGADMQSAAGEPMDNNLNAGLDVLRGDPSQGLTTLTTVSSDPIPPVIGGATAGLTAKSKITISDDFLVAGVTLTISVTYPNDPDLSAVLRSPDGTVVRLFTAVGSTGTKTNFTNTTFDDAATTPIQNGGPPFFGRFNPQEPLSAFKNHTSKGAWTLEITDSVAGRTGAITGWTLNLLKPISGTGLGEIVADQSTASFRIFTFNPTNPLSGNVWTAVGPAGIGAKGPGLNAEVSGRVGALATDPSDPSGNTVYLGAASGGVWKTTNFLTTSPAGPTYVPLTDFGPTFGLNIGGLAVFGRNNNPNQSIVFAGTGEGAALGFGIPGRPTRGDSPVMSVRGVGFLRSLDGGSSWTLLDSTVNFDAQGNPLPLNSPLRDHIFVGTTTYRVVVDPTPTPGGETIIYAALSDVDSNGQPVTGGGRSGGIWRSVDTGKTWQRMRAGQATDVILDYASGTGAPGGNIQIIYAAFRGEGVFSSPNRGQVFNLMTGTTGNPLILAGGSPPSPVGVLAAKSDYYAGQATPNGAGKGRIILSRPSLTGNPLEDTLYQGWLYAAVVSSPSIVTADNQLVKGGHLEGLYLTKDFGQNWTRVRIPSVSYGDHTGPRVPSNDDRLPDYDPLGEETPYGEAPDIADPADLDLDNAGFGNYSFALAVDPNNPNVVYLGGTDKYHYSGLLRIDTTGIADPHAFYISNTDSEGKIWDNTQVADATGGERRVFPNDPNPAAAQHSAVTLSFGPSTNAPVPPFNPVTSPVLNLISDPLQPFLVGSTILTTNAAFFNNTGAQVKWIPFDKAVKPDPFNNDPNDPWSLAASGQHQILAVKDQITGRTRLIFGNDEGVYTAVDQGNGKLLGSLGSVSSLDTPTGDVTIVNGSRNGNLQTTQFYYGAVQPSNLAAQASQLQGMFYGTTEATGTPNSNPNIINVGQPGYGNLSWTRPNVIRATGTGIGIVQTGPSEPGFAAVYRYLWPSEVDNAVATDFFQRDQTSRTFNLLQNTAGQIDPLTGPVFDVPDGQWPFRKGYNFAVNPINGDQIVISSEFGRLFSTENAGKFWNVIGQPGSLDGSNAQALAFGAPDPNGPGGSGNLNAFVYAGTIRGNVFVTFTGGGTQGNQWTNISSGLDGTPVQAIVTNPTRGSHEAYAVTQANVYHMVDSSVPGASWTKITSNLFALTASLFGNPAQVDQRERNLTSIAADWRYLVPDDLNNPTGPSHPLLYVGGEGGVVRSLDDGKSWSLFPSPDPSGLSTTPTPPGGRWRHAQRPRDGPRPVTRPDQPDHRPSQRFHRPQRARRRHVRPRSVRHPALPDRLPDDRRPRSGQRQRPERDRPHFERPPPDTHRLQRPERLRPDRHRGSARPDRPEQSGGHRHRPDRLGGTVLRTGQRQRLEVRRYIRWRQGDRRAGHRPVGREGQRRHPHLHTRYAGPGRLRLARPDRRLRHRPVQHRQLHERRQPDLQRRHRRRGRPGPAPPRRGRRRLANRSGTHPGSGARRGRYVQLHDRADRSGGQRQRAQCRPFRHGRHQGARGDARPRSPGRQRFRAVEHRQLYERHGAHLRSPGRRGQRHGPAPAQRQRHREPRGPRRAAGPGSVGRRRV